MGSIDTNPIETLNMAYGQDGIDKNSYTMSCYGEPYSGSEQIVSTSGAYDFNGNPLLFEDVLLEWNKGCMIGHGNTALEYDINGIRQKKYFYDNDRVHVYYTEDDRIHKEVISENGATTKTLKYFYDESGICGLNYMALKK